MKKIFALLIAAILVVSIAVTALAANPSSCSHSRTKWVNKRKATCQVTGWDWLVCQDCGKALYDRTTPKTAHSGNWTTKRAACHKSGGLKERTCTVCGTHEEQHPSGAAHSWSCTGGTYYPLTNITSFNWKCNSCGMTAGTSEFGRPSRPSSAPNAHLGQ